MCRVEALAFVKDGYVTSMLSSCDNGLDVIVGLCGAQGMIE